MSSTASLFAAISSTSSSKEGSYSATYSPDRLAQDEQHFRQLLNQHVQRQAESSTVNAPHPEVDENKTHHASTEKSNSTHTSSQATPSPKDKEKESSTTPPPTKEHEAITTIWQALQSGYAPSASSSNTAQDRPQPNGSAGDSLSSYNTSPFSMGNLNNTLNASLLPTALSSYSAEHPLGLPSSLGQENPLFSSIIKELSSTLTKNEKEFGSNELSSTPQDSTVTLSGDWSALSSHVLQTSSPQDTTIAHSVRSLQAVLGEYWVPPVNIQSISPSETAIQMQLGEGHTLTLQLQLDQSQTAHLQIQAPAAILEALQARLAPLQEALLQQGLTLAPVQWSATKPITTRAVSSVNGNTPALQKENYFDTSAPLDALSTVTKNLPSHSDWIEEEKG
jgi:hypothetical protein